ncbi:MULTISPECIES: HrgC protein [Fusobacterium]|uniref:HrgC protein n=1 Tax=Fusobacterium TaxID=848 RepID=UPI001F4F8813|nr:MULTISPECIES: HrgC protein [Fusobacterium]MDD7392709.1 HrgC protein [Fusobacteriaceae bacterium]MCI7223628.1 HrgC protein [Fusobacterium sp.]MDD7411217.1 HrgC protein [Fusobacteriaceae bacterium]MDY5306241.1 HrgC protein [Fusobacterium gastrosuis]MDY5713516.1 HrgC protein [Fusobacterium gastrosuis]
MATAVTLKKGMAIQKSYVGFSWTTFFFGFFVPLFRGDMAWFIVMLILSLCTLGLAQFVMCFLYNGIYTKKLLSQGFEPADNYSEGLLRAKGYIY